MFIYNFLSKLLISEIEQLHDENESQKEIFKTNSYELICLIKLS